AGLTASLRGLAKRLGSMPLAVVAAAAVVAGACVAVRGELTELAGRARSAKPLAIGLGADRPGTARAPQAATPAEARIPGGEPPRDVRGTALLPLLTGRSFLGGLDPDCGLEHAFAGLGGGRLAGRTLAEWSDAELESFCRRYNVGWVVCRTEAAGTRFAAWPPAQLVGPLPDGGLLFEVGRARSFVLKGRATAVRADWRRIALDDVEAEA